MDLDHSFESEDCSHDYKSLLQGCQFKMTTSFPCRLFLICPSILSYSLSKHGQASLFLDKSCSPTPGRIISMAFLNSGSFSTENGIRFLKNARAHWSVRCSFSDADVITKCEDEHDFFLGAWDSLEDEASASGSDVGKWEDEADSWVRKNILDKHGFIIDVKLYQKIAEELKRTWIGTLKHFAKCSFMRSGRPLICSIHALHRSCCCCNGFPKFSLVLIVSNLSLTGSGRLPDRCLLPPAPADIFN